MFKLFPILLICLGFSATIHDVEITAGMSFSPSSLEIVVGDIVRWTNNHSSAHTATSTDTPEAWEDANISSGATFQVTFNNDGVFPYDCAYHSSMTGTITVGDITGCADNDADGICDDVDPDDDNDGCLDDVDDASFEWDDDYDNDGTPDDCDDDDDNDGADDDVDSDDNNEFECSDDDGDTCDDCSNGSYDTDSECNYDINVELHAGANLISFYALPDDVSVGNIFAGTNGVIGEGVGAVYIDGNWIGSLTEVSQDDGYWVKVSDDTTLELTDAEPVNYDADGIVIYDVHYGKNLISYPFMSNQFVADALGDAAAYVYALAGEGVAALYSNDAGAWVGSLDAFEGGHGYWLVATENFSFAYNNMIDVVIKPPQLQAVPEEYRFTQSTQQAFFIIDSLDISGDSIEAEDLIIAYNEAVVVGARYWNGIDMDVPAMGDDGSDGTEGYCRGGDIITFKLLDASSGNLINLQSDSLTVWAAMGISIINLYPDPDMGENLSILPVYYFLEKPYPNPFNPVTNIQYSLPKNTYLELVVYDISGRQVQTLISNFKIAGYHSINWNASSYPSGMYFVKMVTGEFTQTQKLVLVK